MVNICSNYGDIYDITFNTKKTECLCVTSDKSSTVHLPTVYLNGVNLVFVESKKYLGYISTNHFRDDADIERQKRSFYVSANMLLRKFSSCSFDVKCMVFKVYCHQLYGAHLWFNHTASALRKLKVAYNNAARIFLGFDKRCSASAMFVTNNLYNFDALRRKQMYGFTSCLLRSVNMIVRLVYDCLYIIYGQI